MTTEKKMYVFLAEGFEEIEALTVVDILRRASLPCVTVAVTDEGNGLVTGSHNISVKADTGINEITADMAKALILPGGMPGTNNLRDSEPLKKLLTAAARTDVHIAAICAAPTVLASMGLLDKINSTCYPGREDVLKENGAIFSEESVITDNKITTSRGMGTAIDFSLELVRLFKGETEAKELAKSIVYEK